MYFLIGFLLLVVQLLCMTLLGARYFLIGFLLLVTQLFCVTLLGVSCFPGAMGDFTWTVMLLVFGFAPFVLAGTIIGLLIWQWRSRKVGVVHPEDLPRQRTRQYPQRLTIATGIILVLTIVLLQTNTPQKLAFELSRPAFERIAKDKAQCNGAMISQALGVYRVEECDRDSKGGVYFKTGAHGFMFDECAYGFAYKPNAKGSDRFGWDTYAHTQVSGDWSWFKACNDFL
jgi:hypothetical protein